MKVLCLSRVASQSCHRVTRLGTQIPIALALVFLLVQGAQAQNALLTLETLGGAQARATGVSADGTIVVGRSQYSLDTPYAEHAFVWSNGSMLDLGTLGGDTSRAFGVSGNGDVVVGYAQIANADEHAFKWSAGTGMVDLGTLGGWKSSAYAASATGSTIVGSSQMAAGGYHAFRWVMGFGMQDIGTLGGSSATALAVSADGDVVAGYSSLAGDSITRAFRWTSATDMEDLGTLGGINSYAYGISGDGSLVVGNGQLGSGEYHAFRWTEGVVGLTDLGTLGGTSSSAAAISADGTVVVGGSQIEGNSTWRAYRWTSDTGMQTVEDWLRANGVVVPQDITFAADATNSDGSVVVGILTSDLPFIARVTGGDGEGGGGLITVEDVGQSLGTVGSGGNTLLAMGGTVIHGAHSRPLSRRVAAGQNTAWVAGDWGPDDHGSRSGNLGLAEVGIGHSFEPLQLNLAVGHAWARQDAALDGRAEMDGEYLLAEALIPICGQFWVTLGGYGYMGEAELRRGYLNAGVPDTSSGDPDVTGWGVRVRLEWDRALVVAETDLSPYVDLSYSEAKLDAYTETGGGFPAKFDARTDHSTELRLGMNVARPLPGDFRLIGIAEAAHRFEDEGEGISGEMIGLFGFDFAGDKRTQDWLRGGIGLEHSLAGGVVSLMLNATTDGGVPSQWLALNWQVAF